MGDDKYVEYVETAQIVILLAEAKMRMNSHKGDITKVNCVDLHTLGKLEFDELLSSIQNPAAKHLEVLEEVADIVNYAIAIACQSVKGYKERKLEAPSDE